jgi:excisionase family DNA binding protein
MCQDEQKEWLTPEELADALRVNAKTVGNWAREGRIPSLRLPNRGFRFNYAAVLAALGATPDAEKDDGEEEG